MSTQKTKASATKKAAKKAASKKSSVKKADSKESVKQATVIRESEVAEKKSGPIVFSLDDVEALVATRKKEKQTQPSAEAPQKKVVAAKKKAVTVQDAPVEKRVHAAASLADILGFNPAEKKKATTLEKDSVPKKWEKYYNLLLDLRKHLSDELDLHTADTLQHNDRGDAGDRRLEDDAGTDAFDRDFALSLVSSEQDALNEVEEAILRIKDGSYGVCEVTGQPINPERLAAVPFTRYSVEGQVEFEKNKSRKVERNAGGLFADSADAPKITSDDEEEE
jgi:RNA polymerase-binding transcription factor DksA